MRLIDLCEILRPNELADVIGQEHLTSENGILSKMIRTGNVRSMVLWGPPGTGKTTIAKIMSKKIGKKSYDLNATTDGVKELRKILDVCEDGSVIVVDEIHRWSKNVQDVLLPHIESSKIIFIGMTVENAKFGVNKALLSRCMVQETVPINRDSLVTLYKKAKQYFKDRGVDVAIDKNIAATLIVRSNGDARKLIACMDTLVNVMAYDTNVVTMDDLNSVIPTKNLFFDASGSERYDYAHCYQEAIQHSDVNGSIYWLAKWLSSGEDPAYICRRMLITSFEDCSSNPMAPLIAMAASYTTEKTGMPECMIPMAYATCEMAFSSRDKTAYHAIKEAFADIENGMSIDVPPELRAGTSGWLNVVKKKYVDEWKRDVW